MRISIVVAVAENDVIGVDGAMPWHLSTDLKRFKALTMGKPLVMGRKTFDSVGKPLPGRTSIVVTRDEQWQSEGAVPVHSFGKAVELGKKLAVASDVDEVCIVGGGDIYRQGLELADVLHVTRVHAKPDGDVTFPEIDRRQWRVVSEEKVPAGAKDSIDTTYIVYHRVV